MSFVIKLPERKIIIGEPFVSQLVELFGFSLRRLAFLDCGVGHQSIAEICKSCPHLERLDIAIPVKDIVKAIYCPPLKSLTLSLASFHDRRRTFSFA